jgi:hypothetical protein
MLDPLIYEFCFPGGLTDWWPLAHGVETIGARTLEFPHWEWCDWAASSLGLLNPFREDCICARSVVLFKKRTAFWAS